MYCLSLCLCIYPLSVLDFLNIKSFNINSVHRHNTHPSLSMVRLICLFLKQNRSLFYWREYYFISQTFYLNNSYCVGLVILTKLPFCAGSAWIRACWPHQDDVWLIIKYCETILPCQLLSFCLFYHIVCFMGLMRVSFRNYLSVNITLPDYISSLLRL